MFFIQRANFIIFIIGAIVATSLLFLEPANENDNLLFIILCGIIGVSGMMLPGLSGSFILILMGNYELILVSAISEFNYVILSFFLIGSVLGLVISSLVNIFPSSDGHNILLLLSNIVW